MIWSNAEWHLVLDGGLELRGRDRAIKCIFEKIHCQIPLSNLRSELVGAILDFEKDLAGKVAGVFEVLSSDPLPEKTTERTPSYITADITLASDNVASISEATTSYSMPIFVANATS